jgi:signal peptidase I
VNPRDVKNPNPTLRILRDWLRLAAMTLALFVLLRGFVVEAFTIPSSSMERTLLVGDFLLVNKALYGAEIPGLHRRLPAMRDPRRGEVVVFRPAHDRQRSYVKRVVGLPGDTLEMRDKALRVNGAPQEEGYARHTDRRRDPVHPGMVWQAAYLASAPLTGRYTPSRDNWGPILVPPDKYFVMGDNRDNSEDSRHWGFVDRSEIAGHPWLIYLSVSPARDSAAGWLGRVRWDRTGERVH